MTDRVSVIIPAYREEGRIGRTVAAASAAVRRLVGEPCDTIVVDDGSPDGTADEAAASGARVVRLPQNRGKGAAMLAGLREATGEVLLVLDADLLETAAEAHKLLEPVLAGDADMAVATFPHTPGRKAGFGLVMRLARWGLRRGGAPPMDAPLSGQRAFTRHAWERIGCLDAGFGTEMGLNLDAARLGLRVVEVGTAMAHRPTGRDLRGFLHRGRQFRDVLRAILRRSGGGNQTRARLVRR